MEQHLIALEKEVEYTLFQLMELEVEEEIVEMAHVFGVLLSALQKAELIDLKMQVLVDPETQLPETKLLLQSLIEVRNRFFRRRKLLTHRDILKIWLRKNKQFKADFLPFMF